MVLWSHPLMQIYYIMHSHGSVKSYIHTLCYLMHSHSSVTTDIHMVLSPHPLTPHPLTWNCMLLSHAFSWFCCAVHHTFHTLLLFHTFTCMIPLSHSSVTCFTIMQILKMSLLIPNVICTSLLSLKHSFGYIIKLGIYLYHTIMPSTRTSSFINTRDFVKQMLGMKLRPYVFPEAYMKTWYREGFVDFWVHLL